MKRSKDSMSEEMDELRRYQNYAIYKITELKDRYSFLLSIMGILTAWLIWNGVLFSIQTVGNAILITLVFASMYSLIRSLIRIFRL